VLLNLIINAMEAMRDTPAADRCVEVRTRMDGGLARVEIVDHGSGVSPAHQQKVFEPFFTTKAEGIGLGLALSRSIIELHGGTIRAENRAQSGAAFIFTLPASGAPAGRHVHAGDNGRMTLH
jgi:signal transduction histidine kinase